VRLFVAVDPPDGEVRALDAALGARDEQLRWVPPEQWHLTLVFCGEVSPALVPELSERLARGAARTPQFDVGLAAAGSFPKQAVRARVLWVGLRGDSDTLTRLAERCAAAVRRTGIAVEDRTFRPHLTVARARRDTVDVRTHVQQLSSYAGEPWRVTSVRLVHSTLGAKVRHETLTHFPLAEFPLAEGAPS
jgi:RNA 2',3'-cyclic 3'-phosphodiesterase